MGCFIIIIKCCKIKLKAICKLDLDYVIKTQADIFIIAGKYIDSICEKDIGVAFFSSTSIFFSNDCSLYKIYHITELVLYLN